MPLASRAPCSSWPRRFPHIWQRGKDRHDARRCRGRRAEVRRRAIAGGPGRDGAVQAGEARRSAERQGSWRQRARPRLRRESGRRPYRRRQARCRVALQGAVAERGGPEPRRAEGTAARHRRLRGSVRGRRVLDEAAHEGHPRSEEAAGGDACRRGSASRRRCAGRSSRRRAPSWSRRAPTRRRRRVTVLSAYKQGYSWLYDVVRPALAGKAVDRITIRFAEIGPPAGWKQQGMFAPTRWLLELYPIDEILASELKIDLKNIRFEMTPIGSPAYEVVATTPAAPTSSAQTFEPTVVERAVLRSLPRLRARARDHRLDQGGRRRPHRRSTSGSRPIPERFWDRFQAKTLPALYDHVMALGRGKPRAGGRAVLRRADRRPHAERARLPPADRSGADLVDGGAPRGDLLQHAAFLRRDGPLHARRRARLSGPGDSGRCIRRPTASLAARRSSVTGFDAPRPSVVVEYVERDGRARRSAARHPEDRGRSAADAGGARARRAGRHRPARSARQGRYRERRARRAGASAADEARRSHDDVGRAGHRGRSRTLHDCALPASTATRSPITISAASA